MVFVASLRVILLLVYAVMQVLLSNPALLPSLSLSLSLQHTNELN